MLSIIIATLNSENELASSLVALVPGAMDGLVSEVIVADGGSHDDTAAVADVAGCNFTVIEGPLGRRLKTAATTARAPWLLFLRPGTVPEASWTGEVRRFIERSPPDAPAAVFGRGRTAQPAWKDMLLLLTAMLGALPRPEQGLLIAHPFYDEIGGHSDLASDPETDLIRRIGRRRIVTLTTGAASR
jgi:cellulose synthase/poly-beta-1,6-N-acetylglucosamine synthase-like glycosyltransferase